LPNRFESRQAADSAKLGYGKNVCMITPLYNYDAYVP
jgi:hypothetical protein